MGVAYRYPGEDEPEPEPSKDDLFKALDVIGQIATELRSLAPLQNGRRRQAVKRPARAPIDADHRNFGVCLLVGVNGYAAGSVSLGLGQAP